MNVLVGNPPWPSPSRTDTEPAMGGLDDVRTRSILPSPFKSAAAIESMSEKPDSAEPELNPPEPSPRNTFTSPGVEVDTARSGLPSLLKSERTMARGLDEVPMLRAYVNFPDPSPSIM